MTWKYESERHQLSAHGIKTSYGRRRRDNVSDLKNKKMNDEVYKLRRKVIDILYDAKELYELPYITVRVTEDHPTVLGQAWIKKNTMWITERAIDTPKDELRMIVYHEILHTVFGVRHQKNCPLMGEYIDTVLSKSKADELFKKYAKEYGGDYDMEK